MSKYKESLFMRIKQALETVEYNESLKAYQISARYWADLEPDTINLYSDYSELKRELVAEIVKRWQ